jgi:hypothetical protein
MKTNKNAKKTVSTKDLAEALTIKSSVRAGLIVGQPLQCVLCGLGSGGKS